MTNQTSALPDKAPPGPKGLPVFGSLFSIRNNPHLVIDRMAKQYGDVFAMRFGSVPTVIISHPDLLRDAFAKTELADRWVGEIMGILSHHGKDLALAPYGEHWRHLQRFANRELLSMRRLQEIRERHIEEVINSLVEEVGENADSNEPIDPPLLLSRSNAMIMFRAIFGRSEDDTSEFEENRDELINGVFWAFQNATATNPADYIPWLQFLPNPVVKEAERQRAIREDIVKFLISKVRSRPDFDLYNPACLVDVMLARERDGDIDEETMRLLIGDLLFAGIDTSAQTVTWLLLILANRPEVQVKIHEEMDRIVGADATPTLEDRERMPYLNSVIMESMRYRTVGPLALPHKAAEACEVGGYTIPQGAQVLGNAYSIHHDPRFWDSPNEFIPDRFMPQEDGSPSPNMTNPAYMPFGVGRRGCPGARFGELVIWTHASRLLHKYQFSPADDSINQIPEDEVFGLTVSPNPFTLKITRWCG